jgi:GNAT superfamily N-acetyltransferase
VAKQLRLLLDTNVLIPLQDSLQVLSENLASLHRLAVLGGHQILYHPATIADFERDSNAARREMNLRHIRRYPALENPAACPWNTPDLGPNDACDNQILYALHCDAVHALITEDRGLLAKARKRGLGDRTYSIQTAEDWLARLHEPFRVVLPSIQDVPLHRLTPELPERFFDSLREGYPPFDGWFREKARDNRKAWVYRDEKEKLGAICIYAMQVNEKITNDGLSLDGKALKLCTFKVADSVRGRKIGELFLKAAFRYATQSGCEHIFIHADADRHVYLIDLLTDFGFVERGRFGRDVMLVKAHPLLAPEGTGVAPFEYNRQYYPHYLRGPEVRKFLIPIQPQFHRILFPDYSGIQTLLFTPEGSVGNAIKLAYLCKAQTLQIRPGDVVLFYRTGDEQLVTSVGVVERFEVLADAARIAGLVRRRTVYSIEQIEAMATEPTKVILFRLVEHLPTSVSYQQLLADAVVSGPIQSITKISDVQFSRVLARAGH